MLVFILDKELHITNLIQFNLMIIFICETCSP